MQQGSAVFQSIAVCSNNSSRQPVVFSAPNFPLPMETSHTAATVGLVVPPESGNNSRSSNSSSSVVSMDDLLELSDNENFDQFFSSLQQSQQSVAAEQHYDKYPQQQQQMTSVSTVVKQEKETGFFDQWSQQQQEEDVVDELDRYSPEDKKRYESSLIKEELSCRLQLKMMKEGKDFSAEVEDQSARRDYPISEETRKLQQVRREKNREAAKKCRLKKKLTEKQLEQKVRESEREKRQMEQQLRQSTEDFASVLRSFRSWPCFIAYLRLNRHVLRSPALKAELQRFVKASGGQMSGSSSHFCCGGVGATHPCQPSLQTAAVEPCGVEQ